MTKADADQIEARALAALANFPDAFRKAAKDVVIRVEDWPSQDLLDSLGMGNPIELTGLYSGIPLTEKSTFDLPGEPDTIWLFRRPILAELASRDGVTLEELVTHILVHELAHHLGYTDDDIAAIDRWWE